MRLIPILIHILLQPTTLSALLSLTETKMISSCLPNNIFSFPLLKPQTLPYGPPTKIIVTKKGSHHMETYFSHNKKHANISCVVQSPSRESFSDRKHGHGIGISRFHQGKNYLITGATGFIGKGSHLLCTIPTVTSLV